MKRLPVSFVPEGQWAATDPYESVYFLNEPALNMYRETGEDFEVTKIVSAEEVAAIPWGPSFQSFYVPKEGGS